jgi:hypothetical protein
LEIEFKLLKKKFHSDLMKYLLIWRVKKPSDEVKWLMKFCSSRRRKFELDSIFPSEFSWWSIYIPLLNEFTEIFEFTQDESAWCWLLGTMIDEDIHSHIPFAIVSSFKITDIVCLGTSGNLLTILQKMLLGSYVMILIFIILCLVNQKYLMVLMKKTILFFIFHSLRCSALV